MLEYKQVKEQIETMKFPHLKFNILSGFLGEREEALRQKGEAELAEKVKAFKDAMFGLSEFIDQPGTLAPELDNKYKEEYTKLGEFKAFLEEKEPGGKTSYEKITEGMDPVSFELFSGSLKLISNDLDMGIDVDAFPQPESAREEKQNEAKEDELLEDKDDQELIDDDLADIAAPVTSARYIENLRDNGFPKKDPASMSEAEKDIAIDRMLRIMASRELADSDRGDKSKLVSHYTNPVDVNRRATQMKNNTTFKNYIQALKDDPAKLKAALSAATKGHGGGLDDMFKDYVKNQASIRMNNRTILKRYMPTVRERLEILQKQAERYDADEKELASVDRRLSKIQSKGNNSNSAEIKRLREKKEKLELRIEDHSKHYIASEMILLRNMAHAHKGKKASLDKPIPVSDIGEKTIHKWVSSISNNEFMKNDEVIRLIGDGHGGNMMAKARELANASKEGMDKEELKIFNENTIGSRIGQIEEEAGTLAEQLRDAILRGRNKDELMQKSKTLLAESILLDGKVRDPKTGQTDESKMGKDVPWLDVEKMQKNGPESNAAFKTLLGNATPNEMLEHLERLNENGQGAFIKSLAEKDVLKTKSDQSELNEQSEAGEQEKDLDDTFDLDDSVDSEDSRDLYKNEKPKVSDIQI